MSTLSPRPYYLWIKVSKSKAPEMGKPDPELETSKDGQLTGLAGNRPPRAANIEKTAWWIFDQEFDGVPPSGLRIGYSPKCGTREEAVAWLESGKGQEWLIGAETRDLISLSTR
jgi:hypothetical protein